MMTNTFLIFERFPNTEAANTIAECLKENNIDYLLEDAQNALDVNFERTSLESTVSIKVKAEDFSAAEKAIENFYSMQMDGVENDYYLFDFTDEELIEIISKPDEWGRFDYVLAQKILKDRGKEISPEVAKLLKDSRMVELAKPEAYPKYWIYLGYFSAISGGVLGLIIGGVLVFSKKTLPDGNRIYAHRDEERNHGTRILLISGFSLIVWLFVRIKYLS